MAQNRREKILTITDINQKLTVGLDWLDDDLLPNLDPRARPIPLLFRDELGMEHTFILKVRPLDLEQARYDKKPEFMYRGWHAFVKEKRLQVGDRIFIWRDGHGGLRIRADHRPHLPPPLPGVNIPY